MAKTALITGASGGLGLEFAKIYAKEGFDVILVARNEGKLFQLKKELEEKYHIKAFVFAKDLSEQDAAYDVYDYTLENNLEVDTLVNNAGFGDFGNFWEIEEEKQHQLLMVNIVAVVELTRYFMNRMVERKHGQILNLSSVAAFCAGPGMSLYYASKEFVRSFSEAIAEEAKGTGVTVTALCPGPTSTGFEKAANMKDSKMFTLFRPASAKAVAKAGYKAACKGKVLRYYGTTTKLMNIFSRLLPRIISRKFAGKINR